MSAAPTLPVPTQGAIALRLLAIQGAWNYETMLGNGIAFAMEPGLRLLPGGRGGAAYRDAVGRHARYFNAHPYLAAVAVGALLRAELEGAPADRIDRFRTACCGPLGSLGDRLVWAGWLPCCAAVAVAAGALGLGTGGTVLLFLGLYNAGAVWLRFWGLRTGYREGLRVAGALAHPVLRQGPAWLARALALAAGLAVPLVAAAAAPGLPRAGRGAAVAAALAGAALLVRLHGRVEGWRAALAILAVLVLYALVR